MQRERLLTRAAGREQDRAVVLVHHLDVGDSEAEFSQRAVNQMILLVAQLVDEMDRVLLVEILAVLPQDLQALQRAGASVDVLVLVVDLRAEVSQIEADLVRSERADALQVEKEERGVRDTYLLFYRISFVGIYISLFCNSY
eukprot:COSAG06_NODE_11542_length_1494_cov_10.518996_2_plen_141_part_01